MQIDLDPTRIGLRYPVEVGLVGDAQATLQALLPLLQRRDGSLVPGEGPERHEGLARADGRARHRDDMPMKPQVVAHELNELLADDAIVIDRLRHDHDLVRAPHPDARAGSCSPAPAPWRPWRSGLPYAIAAQIAYPDRQVVAFVGDGGFSMLMGEFATAVKYNLPIKVVIIKNNTLGQIKWEQMVFLGNPEYGVELQPIDFAKFAEACGGVGFRIETPDECGRRSRRRWHAAARRRRGGRRPVRAADAARVKAKQALQWPNPRPRRTEPRPDRAHAVSRQGHDFKGR